MSITINGSTGISGVDGSSTAPAFQGTDTDTGLFYSANTVSVSAGGNKVATINAYGIGLGTGSPSSGIGITFPATQSASSDANTLDDYEEGTWTPVLQGGTTAGTYTYDTSRTNGKYIKIGKMVSVFGVYRIDTVTSAGTGVAKITGLPFTAAALDTAWDRIPGMLRVQSGPTLANNGYFCYTESSTFLGIGLQGVADWTEVLVTDADAVGAVWFFQCTYEAA